MFKGYTFFFKCAKCNCRGITHKFGCMSNFSKKQVEP